MARATERRYQLAHVHRRPFAAKDRHAEIRTQIENFQEWLCASIRGLVDDGL